MEEVKRNSPAPQQPNTHHHLSKNQLVHLLALLKSQREHFTSLMEQSRQHALKDLIQESTGEISRLRLHPADLGSDTGEQEAQLSLSTAVEHRLEQVNLAMERMHKGEYGWCLDCGEELPYRRLRLVPEALRCYGCESLREENMALQPRSAVGGKTVTNRLQSLEEDIVGEKLEKQRLAEEPLPPAASPEEQS
jgi:RNA polymerase-binding transcription factor DksA